MPTIALYAMTIVLGAWFKVFNTDFGEISPWYSVGHGFQKPRQHGP